jgi:excisionase family DNA binding protein
MSLQRRFKKKDGPEPERVEARLMSPKQAAKYMCQSVDLIYEKIKRREIPHIVKGNGKRRLYLLDRRDLDKEIEKSKVGVI